MSERTLNFLRKLCLTLPETDETDAFGHPNWRVRKKTFAVLEEYRGHLCVVFKASPVEQALLIEDPRYFRAPYTGRYGWTSLILTGRLDEQLVRRHVLSSFAMIAPKRLRPPPEGALPSPTSKGRSSR